MIHASPVVQSAHHEGLLVVQVAGPGRLAGQGLLAVPVQADDRVVEHRVARLLLHVVRTNLGPEKNVLILLKIYSL